MKPRHAILTVALVAAAALVLFGDKEPEADIVESVERPAPAAAPAVAAVVPAAPEAGGQQVMRLIPRDQLLGAAGGDDGGAFHTRSWNPPAPEAPPRQVAPPPPMAPAIPFAFIGKTLSDGKWDIHLSQGDRIHTVHAGDVIDGVWRIDAVAPPMMTISYLPLSQVQTMNIGANE